MNSTNDYTTTEAANDGNTLLCEVQLGQKLIAENILFTVIKKHNRYVWRLKAENGDIVNVFYALSQRWQLHFT